MTTTNYESFFNTPHNSKKTKLVLLRILKLRDKGKKFHTLDQIMIEFDCEALFVISQPRVYQSHQVLVELETQFD